MKKTLILGIVVCFVLGALLGYCTAGWAVDVDLKWDPVTGATGYRVYQSINAGILWTTSGEGITDTTYKVIGVPENALVLFRVSAYNTSSEVIRLWSGAWYDHRLKPVSAPGGNSVP